MFDFTLPICTLCYSQQKWVATSFTFHIVHYIYLYKIEIGVDASCNSGTASLFQHTMLHVFVLQIVVVCAILILLRVSYMTDMWPHKRARRTVGVVCEACGKEFDSSYAFDMHRTRSYLRAVRATPCFTPDDGSTRIQKVATDRSTMSTAMLQSLRLARRTHCTD